MGLFQELQNTEKMLEIIAFLCNSLGSTDACTLKLKIPGIVCLGGKCAECWFDTALLATKEK